MSESLERAVRREHRARKNRRSDPRSDEAMEALLALAATAVSAARDVRQRWRRNAEPASAQRCEEIRRALDQLHQVALPLREEHGRLPRKPGRARRWGTRLRAASTAVQAERRKLWKMQRRCP